MFDRAGWCDCANEKISSGCGLQAAFFAYWNHEMRDTSRVEIVSDGAQKIPPQREGLAEIQAFEHFQAT